MEQETPPPSPSRRPVSPLVAVPVAVLIVAALVYLATRPLGGGEAQASFFVIGSARPGVQLGQIAPGTAQDPVSPTMTLTDLNGAPVALADFAGRPIWVIFWKTACEPCEAEAPDVAAAYAAHQDDGLVILGVDLWDSSAVVQDYADGHVLDYPIAVATTSAFMDAYGVWGAPTHYFIDSAGIIQDRYFGPMSHDLIDQSLEKIL
jgi:cytochrome c biogenesis protein CcmG/thiol:disulfide interchange protein DsbE